MKNAIAVHVKLLWELQREGVKGLEPWRSGRRRQVDVKLDSRTVRGKAQAAAVAGGLLRTGIPDVWCLQTSRTGPDTPTPR